MAAQRLVQHQPLSPKLPKKQKGATVSMPVTAPVTALQSKEHLHSYFYNTILSNITYYKALARYRYRRSKLIIYTSSSHYKNLRLYYRLTEKGLCLLKTQYAIKPRNPE